jgi:Na+/H+-dicarboxylate symporter
VDRKIEVFRPVSGAKKGATTDARAGAQITVTGSLFACTPDRRKAEIAKGLSIAVQLQDSGGQICAFSSATAVATYFDFLGGIFITFLLMLFVPTLVLSLLRAVLDSAGAVKQFGPAFLFFAISSTAASAVGAVCGLAVAQLWPALSKGQVQNLSRSLGGQAQAGGYDPHPLLKQLGQFVPTKCC